MPSDPALPAHVAVPSEAATPAQPDRDATVTLVVAIARNGVIGLDGGLPWPRLPGDLPRLKALTVGHVVVMGRVTYESIGRPLPCRTTVVVTRQPGWYEGGSSGSYGAAADGAAAVLVAHSVEEALDKAGQVDPQVFVLGGAQVYAEAVPAADVLEVSWVDAAPAGDTSFPHIDWDEWVEVARVPHEGWSAARYERVLATRAQTRADQR